MLSKNLFKQLIAEGRSISLSKSGDEALGALSLLPGVWSNRPIPGRGWNMIALPFIPSDPNDKVNYRLLMNQYNEELKFTLVDKAVANRGIKKTTGGFENSDQFLVTLDYQQHIKQVVAEDFPDSGLAGKPKADIHHEPGLFLMVTDDEHVTDNLPIARLASVPHGNSVLAMGRVETYKGAPKIPATNGLPIGITDKMDSPYMAPYKHFADQPFEGVFSPIHPNELLRQANKGVDIVRTTELHFDTEFATGGIHNIPFIKRQADASDMSATFWIQELAEKDANGNAQLRIQYSQTVFLDFFERNDGKPGRIKWPHISINTMEKISDSAV